MGHYHRSLVSVLNCRAEPALRASPDGAGCSSGFGQKRGVHGQIKKELRRRSAIEAVIGHCKTDGHLGHNFLKAPLGDQINAVMTAVGYNFRLILKWLRLLLRSAISATQALFMHNNQHRWIALRSRTASSEALL